jgi:hypothetical protein
LSSTYEVPTAASGRHDQPAAVHYYVGTHVLMRVFVSAECGLQVALPGPALIRHTTFTMPHDQDANRTPGRRDAALYSITTVRFRTSGPMFIVLIRIGRVWTPGGRKSSLDNAVRAPPHRQNVIRTVRYSTVFLYMQDVHWGVVSCTCDIYMYESECIPAPVAVPRRADPRSRSPIRVPTHI